MLHVIEWTSSQHKTHELCFFCFLNRWRFHQRRCYMQITSETRLFHSLRLIGQNNFMRIPTVPRVAEISRLSFNKDISTNSHESFFLFLFWDLKQKQDNWSASYSDGDSIWKTVERRLKSMLRPTAETSERGKWNKVVSMENRLIQQSHQQTIAKRAYTEKCKQKHSTRVFFCSFIILLWPQGKRSTDNKQ